MGLCARTLTVVGSLVLSGGAMRTNDVPTACGEVEPGTWEGDEPRGLYSQSLGSLATTPSFCL